MEGRILREDLTAVPPKAAEANSRTAEASGRSGGTRYYGYNRGTNSRKRYRSRKYGTDNELIPEGRDLFIVQLLASGVLLLFVMFVAIIDTEGTISIRQKLKASLTKSSTVGEVAESASAVKSKISNRADTVLEIFGGELADNEQTDYEMNGREVSGESDEAAQEAYSNDASVDPETLKQLNESADDNPKN